MKVTLIAAVIPALLVCDPAAMAQVSGMASPTPSVAATSPLGLGAGSAVSQTGIPLGATEIASPGISPAPIVTGTASMQSGSTTCSTLGTSPSGMFGSTSSYDGGGMAVGSAAPATAATSGMSTSGMSATSGLSPTSGIVQTSPMSGMCGAGSSGVVSSSTPTSPTTPGGIARTGVPLGSIEINNLGVSSAAAVPIVSVSPTAAPSPVLPVIPTVTSSPAVSSSMACPTPAHGATSNVC
jgi:hypothetical protein